MNILTVEHNHSDMECWLSTLRLLQQKDKIECVARGLYGPLFLWNSLSLSVFYNKHKHCLYLSLSLCPFASKSRILQTFKNMNKEFVLFVHFYCLKPWKKHFLNRRDDFLLCVCTNDKNVQVTICIWVNIEYCKNSTYVKPMKQGHNIFIHDVYWVRWSHINWQGPRRFY